jgi:hypothetical protein
MVAGSSQLLWCSSLPLPLHVPFLRLSAQLEVSSQTDSGDLPAHISKVVDWGHLPCLGFLPSVIFLSHAQGGLSETRTVARSEREQCREAGQGAALE